MKKTTGRGLFVALAATALASGPVASQAVGGGEAAPVTIEKAAVSFEVATNVFGTLVHGKSTALKGSTRVRESDSALRLEHLEAVLPVESLQTGIKLRDQHMRKYIFQTSDGRLPDVRFEASEAECPRAASASEYSCLASGTLAIRDTQKPFSMTLKIERKGNGYHVVGDGTLTLSSFGIERPSQFGVTTDDDVKVRLELDARTAATAASRAR